MFFLIGGIQPRTVCLDQQVRICPSCGGMSLGRRRVDHYLNLFFIPLFPVKRGVPFFACENCGAGLQEDGSFWEDNSSGVRKKCSNCGRRLAPDFIYCPYCGKTE